MRTSTAYFAGAGTVLAAIVGGLGGGLLIADMVSPKSPKQGTELSRLERRMSAEPVAASNAPSEPVQYLNVTAPQFAAAPPVEAKTDSPNSAPPSVPSSASAPPPASAAPTDTAATAPPAGAPPVVNEQVAASSDAYAKARDTEVKRASERRRAERRQQWVEKRRQPPKRDVELQAVEEKVREVTEPNREFAAEPVRLEMPQIRLFGAD